MQEKERRVPNGEIPLAELHGDVPLSVLRRDVAKSTLLPHVSRRSPARRNPMFISGDPPSRGNIFPAADVRGANSVLKGFQAK